jgi:hypothetical protein
MAADEQAARGRKEMRVREHSSGAANNYINKIKMIVSWLKASVPAAAAVGSVGGAETLCTHR